MKQNKINSLLIGSYVSKEVNNIPGLIITTELSEIIEWLINNPDNKYIFTTYQSADKLKEAILSTNSQFDILIFDEAHKTTGLVEHMNNIRNF